MALCDPEQMKVLKKKARVFAPPVILSRQPHLQIDMPYPVHDNNYYSVFRGRKILSKDGRAYKKVTRDAWLEQRLTPLLHPKLCVVVNVDRPDARRRDVTNILKCLCDSLTAEDGIGAWNDDSQIETLTVSWSGSPGKRVRVIIRGLGGSDF